MSQYTHKIVDGVRVELTEAEIAEFEARDREQEPTPEPEPEKPHAKRRTK